MKKLRNMFVLVLIVSMILALAGCKSEEKKSETADNNSVNSSTEKKANDNKDYSQDANLSGSVVISGSTCKTYHN